MRREWKEVKFFTEKDGRRRPTGLFWWFAVLIGIIVVGVGLQVYQKIQDDRFNARLTPSATVPPTETSPPDATATDTVEPSPTGYVYDDPSTWEFVLRTDPAGTEYWDLQDWQKEQVWHFFEEFWNLYHRSSEGFPDQDVLMNYVVGEYADVILEKYENLESGEFTGYTYIEIPFEDMTGGILLGSHPGDAPVRVEVFFYFDSPMPVTTRDYETGSIVRDLEYVEIRSWTFFLIFTDDGWKIEKAEGEV